MSLWELRRLALLIVVVDGALIVISAAVCVLLGEFNRMGVGTAMFICALPMLLVGAMASSGGALTVLPSNTGPGTPALMQQAQVTDGALHAEFRNVHHEIERSRQLSWTVGLALAGLVMLVLCGVVLLA